MFSSPRLLSGLFVIDPPAYELVYAPAARAEIERFVRVVAPPMSKDELRGRMSVLADVEVLFSGWGAPRVDAAFLSAAPKLKAIFYGAGAISSWATPELFDRGIVVTTANTANAIPVAEYTLSTILFSLKHGWRLVRQTKRQQTFVPRDDAPGNYRSVVGLVGMGMIARLVIDLLRPFDLDVLVYDPFVPSADVAALGAQSVSLETLFARCDVVSLHAPEIEETFGMIDGRLLRSMKVGGTIINSSRGSLIRESQLIEVLCERPDLQAVLDVTEPEPPREGSPLYTLPNVVLTPHIAGSSGRECQRMGQYMVDELARYVRGEPLKWQVSPEVMRSRSVHRPKPVPPARREAISA